MIKDGVEHCVVKMIGGPREGEGTLLISFWPPPAEVEGDIMGRYVRESYSNLPDDVANHPNIIRGAVYRYTERLEN